MIGERRRSGDRGQSLVETALVLPVVILMLLGLFDFGRVVYTYNEVGNAAREGTRVATVNQILTSTGCDKSKPITDPSTPTWSIKTCAASAALSLDLTDADVSVSFGPPPTQPTLGCPASPSSQNPLNIGCTADVTVSTTWTPITPIISSIWSSIPISSTSQTSIERVFP